MSKQKLIDALEDWYFSYTEEGFMRIEQLIDEHWPTITAEQLEEMHKRLVTGLADDQKLNGY